MKPLSLAWLGLTLGLAAAQDTGARVDLQWPSWSVQSQNPADGTGQWRDGAWQLHRGAAGAGGYMLRVFRDVTVQPRTVYALTFRLKVDGPGQAEGLVFCGDRQGKWDEQHLKSTATLRAGPLTAVRSLVAATPDTVRFRIDFRASGANTTVTVQDVTLTAIGEQPELALTPSAAAVTLDGRLDDPLWRDALKLTPFRVLGDVARPAAVGCEARLAVKDGYLYLGYRLAEPNLKGLRARPPQGGGAPDPIAIYEDDCTETFLSTDQVSYSHVLVNAAGARHWDQQQLGRSTVTWYPSTYAGYLGDWDAKAAVGDGEWTCELRINLADLFGHAVGGDQQLYLNVTRHRAQRPDTNLTWVPITGQFYAVPREFAPVVLHLPPLAGPAVAPPAVDSRFTHRLAEPDLLLAGTPVRLTTTAASAFALPGSVTVDDRGAPLDAGVKAGLQAALTVPGGGAATVVCTVDPALGDAAWTAAQAAQLRSPEAFRLRLTPGRAELTGRSRDGLLRGVATLTLLASRARCTSGRALPALTLDDAPRLPFRGVMGQPTKGLIDLAFRLRLNKALLCLDSFGGPTVFPFESLPIGGKRYTKAELVEVFDYARARGVEPIPYFASWGRVQYLKVAPGGKAWLVDDVDALQQGYRNLDVANPATHKVMLGLQQEILDTLHPQSFCIAMDEAHFGPMVTSAAARAKGWKPSDWYRTALQLNADFLRARGVKMYLWGDMIDPGHNGPNLDLNGPELLAKLPRDMAILDWKYSGREEITVDYPSIAMFTAAGLPTIGCPWFAPKSIPRLARSLAQHGGQGLLLTAWNDSTVEGMPAEWQRALALTAYYGWSPEDCDLAHLPFVPDALLHGAVYWTPTAFPAGPTRSLTTADGLVGGHDLMRWLGLPEDTSPAFLTTPFQTYRGAQVAGFRQAGQPAAVAVTGRQAVGLVNGDFTRGLTAWQLQTPDEQFTATVEAGALKITRVSGQTFCRVTQDVRVDPALEQVLRFRVKVTGPGKALVWTYSGDEKFKWDEPKSLYFSGRDATWTEHEIVLPPRYASARVCLSAEGAGTTAWFADVNVLPRGAAGAQAAAAAKGVTWPVGTTARTVTFWHAVNRQLLADEDMHANLARFRNVVPGEYRVTYADGSVVDVPLAYGVNVVAANDPALGRRVDVGLFGTLGGVQFINLPTFTWLNPFPAKPLTSISVRPGNSKDLTLLVFGVAVE